MVGDAWEGEHQKGNEKFNLQSPTLQARQPRSSRSQPVTEPACQGASPSRSQPVKEPARQEPSWPEQKKKQKKCSKNLQKV